MHVLFFYSGLNGSETENSMYGYISGDKFIIDDENEEIKGTIADKITGTWKMPHREEPFTFTLRITGCVVSDLSQANMTSPPQNAMGDISKKVLDSEKEEDHEIVDDSEPASGSMETEEEDEIVKYVPVDVVEEEDTDADKVYDNVDVMPEYPGGMVEMLRFISRNMEYPKECSENGIQGKVLVKFIISKDGVVYNARIEKGINAGLDKEALRVGRFNASLDAWYSERKTGQCELCSACKL
ncbi:energy transducer TonB [uncultured Bacteroides sp.]|uniref:energy transducer TonB n=2 Tax=uncultured Bacteroides sp. TaxID=162156 RepID=UPI00262407EA|nr:TonB family protein [uncultured Bacteroides sp.]